MIPDNPQLDDVMMVTYNAFGYNLEILAILNDRNTLRRQVRRIIELYFYTVPRTNVIVDKDGHFHHVSEEHINGIIDTYTRMMTDSLMLLLFKAIYSAAKSILMFLGRGAMKVVIGAAGPN